MRLDQRLIEIVGLLIFAPLSNVMRFLARAAAPNALRRQKEFLHRAATC